VIARALQGGRYCQARREPLDRQGNQARGQTDTDNPATHSADTHDTNHTEAITAAADASAGNGFRGWHICRLPSDQISHPFATVCFTIPTAGTASAAHRDIGSDSNAYLSFFGAP
jgi:hypothetical protein